MHYKNGREAKAGDPAVFKNYNGDVVAGVLHSLVPGNSTCNGQLAVLIPGATTSMAVTIGDGYHAEDLFMFMDNRPPISEAPALVQQAPPPTDSH